MQLAGEGKSGAIAYTTVLPACAGIPIQTWINRIDRILYLPGTVIDRQYRSNQIQESCLSCLSMLIKIPSENCPKPA